MGNVQEQFSGKRQPLAKILPTQLPLSVNMFMTERCNLRCEFCKHGNDEKKGIRHTDEHTMKLEVVEKLAEDFRKYSYPKLKQAVLTGWGEPLLNNDIDKIVQMLSERVSDRVTILTNGTLLTRELSCRLLDAGLDVLRVSLNGLNGDDYKKYTGVYIDMDEVYENLKFFKEETERRVAQGKKKCLIYVKIINYMVADDERKNTFFDRWKNASDIQQIEALNDTSIGVDFQSLGNVNLEESRYGQELMSKPQVCPRPFIECVVKENGDVEICCIAAAHEDGLEHIIMGNIMDEGLADIWNNRKFIRFRKSLLSGNNMPEICKSCTFFPTITTPEDVLDDAAEDLLEKYDALERKGEK
jgi:radical SAM protein with 4Fe4S-binding SPASM domain